MNKRMLLFILIILVFAGCDTAGPKTQTGAVAGGLLGATAGGIIGHQSGEGLAGAAIGGAIGAVSGGLVGNSWDREDEEARAVNSSYLPLTQIAAMAAQGTPDAVIINEIQRTRSVYHLNSAIITYLKQNKVSDQVIDYMLQTGGQ